MNLNNSIIGKRVLLFPLEIVDLDHFIQLHREDKNGMMGRFCLREMTKEEARKYVLTLLATGQIKAWACYSKEGKASKKIGYIYLTDVTPFSCKIVGILDKEVLRGLLKVIKRGKYTFSEDALRTMVSWCFNGAGFNRIEYRTFSDNLLSRRLAERAGFIKEGVLRKSFKVDEEFKDMVIYSILKDEYKLPEGKIETVKKE